MNAKKDQDLAKQAAAFAAAELVQNGMLIGLGTGSTAKWMIDRLIEKKNQGLHFDAVATSERSAAQAKAGGISLRKIDEISRLDLTIDGADEIDKRKRMIKGGGGALLREKIVAGMSEEMVVIVDASKVVDKLGKFPLPLEVSPFACKATLDQILSLGYQGSFRQDAGKELYITDNGNYIIDVTHPQLWEDPEKANRIFQDIPGVMSTGFFLGVAGRVFVGHENGTVTTL